MDSLLGARASGAAGLCWFFASSLGDVLIGCCRVRREARGHAIGRSSRTRRRRKRHRRRHGSCGRRARRRASGIGFRSEQEIVCQYADSKHADGHTCGAMVSKSGPRRTKDDDAPTQTSHFTPLDRMEAGADRVWLLWSLGSLSESVPEDEPEESSSR